MSQPTASDRAPRQSNRAFKIANAFVVPILRSPLHGMMSKSIVLLTYIGKKSGRRYTIPVQYAEDAGTIYIFVGNHKQKNWWRNLQGDGAQVHLQLRGRAMKGDAKLLLGNTVEAVDGLAVYARHYPQLAKSQGLKPASDGTYSRNDLAKFAEQAVIVKITGIMPI
jgi:deazaflavin-dependent oxidoreductase (nitroreductase family)